MLWAMVVYAMLDHLDLVDAVILWSRDLRVAVKACESRTIERNHGTEYKVRYSAPKPLDRASLAKCVPEAERGLSVEDHPIEARNFQEASRY
ncbi:hypothetical protein CHU98_g1081 [Xylaria longipes]|nr:hypothetical protein CHU98_g1081 [Xylaria longipes]